MSELEKGAVKAVQDLYDVVHHDILSMDLRKNYETWELLSNARTEGRVFAKLKWPKDRVVMIQKLHRKHISFRLKFRWCPYHLSKNQSNPKQFQNHFYVSQNTVCIYSSQIYSSHKHSYHKHSYQVRSFSLFSIPHYSMFNNTFIFLYLLFLLVMLQQRKYQTQLLLQRLQPEMYKIPQAFLKPYLWLQNRIIRRNRDPQGHWWTTNCLVGFIRHIASLAYHCHEPHDQVDHDCQEAHD
ncbi:uncharacterized protein LOC126588171 isoform X1 [Malus sylvestris]|uniref:uncharacterized protein LOC126588171 isoform X1 n=1 Tax=Malus sylvestris TaxID=3752 RepID=UPI0010AA517A|nr:uncharacterized protein LOC103449565 isoform X1 [Malus domestica]XP_028944171.1 uncharacterized protein LOC103449565 isoform X1 [Malus domestica]XP_028944172.1 uncharacterized protein LOC103449565 isoform X1 [Malus domestica]XP_028944173.1 uncharacterized protein LOC103449565 isoform X1 [Malus domestica]XP_028944174.1 uncharacterized protein LOC103449565 isoform X1 [Malus domestica]XP_050109190.1 uncharacterized protein LOC126588171 isoform X1 [Malus sylvestris]XP_050109191.1 uncharacteriz